MQKPDVVNAQYWKTRESYPSFPFLYERRRLDFEYIHRRLDPKTQSILDLGCGEGIVDLGLAYFTDIQQFYLYDLSEIFIQRVKERWPYEVKNLEAMACDILIVEYPKVDVILLLGLTPSIFEDTEIEKLFSILQTQKIIIRSPCSIESDDIIINKYSEDLQANYAAKYRTVTNLQKLMAPWFDLEDVSRAYPDEIESKYGTKHYMFHGKLP